MSSYQQEPTGYGNYGGQQQGYGQQPVQQHIHVSVGNQANNDPDFLKAQAIMNSELCSCFSDPLICLITLCCHPIQVGLNNSESGHGSCIVGCCCPCLVCCGLRSHVQRLTRTPVDSCPVACLIHYCIPLCATVQEARAIKHLKAAHLRSPVM